MLTRITPELAAKLQPKDHVVSPFSAPPFAPLAITEVTRSPTGERVFLRLSRIRGVSQIPDGWSLATSFWLPPEGYKFNRMNWRWESGGMGWKPPTLAELGMERDSDGFLTTGEA